jgi:hypothetical protein
MTIKQLHDITPADQKIYIGWNGITQELNRMNALDIHAFGKYQIAKIYAIKEDTLEADLAAQPVTEDKQ